MGFMHEPHRTGGLIGRFWRIRTPESVRVGNCFLKGRLLQGDIFYGLRHSGDGFQDYCYVEVFANKYRLRHDIVMGSYGIGDAEEVLLVQEDEHTLHVVAANQEEVQ